MPTRIWKDVLAPGQFYCEGPDGEPRIFSVTSGDIHHCHKAGKAMLAAGLTIPIPAEHQNEAKPKTKQERDKQTLLSNTGWVGDYAIRKGKLWAALDFDDPEVAKKLPSIKFVSPEIEPTFIDGNGHRWNRVITHVALTLRPRWMSQEPFGGKGDLTADALPGGAKPMRWSLASAPIRLSLAFVASGKSQSLQSPLAKRIRLSGAKPMAEAVAEEKPVENPAEEKPVEAPAEDKTGKEKTDEEKFQECKDYLAEYGINLPDDTTVDNFVEHLRIACHALNNFPTDDGTPKPEEGAKTQSGAVNEEPHAMLMSLAKTNPEVKALMDRQASREKKDKEEHKKQLEQRIHALKEKGLPVAKLANLTKELETVRMSLTKDGEVESDLGAKLSLLEEYVGPSLLTTQITGATEVTQPDFGPGLSAKRAQEVEEEICKHGHIGSPAKK